MTIDPVELERLSVELRCGDPSGAKCDKASDMLIKICRALRTGQLVPAQPSDILSPDAIRDCLVTTVLATPAQPSDPWAGQAELLDECQKAASELDRQALANIRTLTDAQPSGDVVEAVAATERQFANAVWDALKGDHNDLRKQQAIIRAHRSAIIACEAARAALGEKP